MRISFSSFDNYETCPLKYKYKEIEKIKEPRTKEQFFGTHLHQVMQYIHTPGFVSPSLENALDFYASHWDDSLFENEMENRGAFSQGVDIIQRYYEDNDIANINIVALEKRFEIDIFDEKNQENAHVISGIIDRIDRTADGYEIIDYKTARKMPTQHDADTSIQLSIYLLAFLKMYPKEKNNLKNLKVSLYYLKHRQKITATRTLEDLSEVARLFLSVIENIEQEKFEPRASKLCSWCGFQNICPMWRHSVEKEKIEHQDAQKAIDEYITLKKEITSHNSRIKKMQTIIEDFMNQEGLLRVFGEDKMIEKTYRKTYSFDEERIREILEPLDKWNDVLKIDGIALRKIAGGLPSPTKKSLEEAKKVEKETPGLTLKKRPLEKI
ncbi:MAG: PD-(D/E)XK nuclease family protein [Candidatus Moraniibacteriota bacterium]|nr:MAG: PD-(D/E)XK nuclease family protein [Candidatus Moranbacteria bacterium]